MPEPRSRSATLTDTFDQDEHLDTARALFERHGEELALPPLAAALHAAGLTAAYKPVPTEAPEFVTAARHDLPFDTPADLGLPVARAPAMRPTRTAGPFRGATGPFWIRLFGPARAYSIFAAGAPRPTFVLTHGRLPRFPRSPYVIDLDGGTVWINARALGPSFPDDAYVGFTVQRGTLTFPHPLAISGDRLTYTGTLEAALDATPAPVTASGNLCPAQASVSGPKHVHITWAPPKVTISLGAGSATFAGSTFELTHYEGPPRLDGELSVLFFPYSISPTTWDAATLTSSVVQFSGTSALDGGWALSLVRPDPSGHLGEAVGPGLYLFYCRDRLHAQWFGGRSIDLADARLLVRQGQLILSSRHGTAAEPFTQTLRLWAVRPEADAPRLPLRLHVSAPFVFAYSCDATVGDGVYATCGVDLDIDRPVTIAGVPLTFPGASQAWFAIGHGASGIRVSVAALARSQSDRRQALALRNALLAVTDPALVVLEGALQADGAVDQGTLRMALGASAWLPTLPDPYVTNQQFVVRERGGVAASFAGAAASLILGTVSWSAPPSPVLGFSGGLGMPFGTQSPPTPDPTRPVQQGPEQIRVPTQTAQGQLLASPAKVDAVTAARRAAAQSQKELQARFEARAASVGGIDGSRGVRLLDVSTRQDLLGVELVGKDRRAAPTFQLRELDVCTPASSLRVFTVPQVQWEPVRTLDRDQDVPHLGYFPTPLASVTDGGATQLAVQSLRLVPAIPDLAVDAVLEEFAAGEPAGLLTTLPFGLRALLELRPKRSTDGRAADTVARNEPRFLRPDLRGGAQIAFVAESGPSGRDDSSSFDGVAIQVRNGVSLETGAPLDLSVLGSVVDPADSVQEMFNNEFGPGAATARVPVTRLDVSGYGGSCFSDWLHRSAAYAQAAKVQFQVIVGRTALEVVKFATVLYPWGIRLTRTVTIERRGGGGVIRRDSGWQASSPGLFQFPPTSPPSPPYIVHPGLLRGLFRVRNIRSTGLAPISFMGRNGRRVTLAPKFFDAQARIDGLEGADELPAEGVLGFLQIEPIGEPLHEDDLRALLDQQGPAGGPVDGVVQVGGSGFRVRATRIEVGVAVGPSGRPELVGTVRSAPQFRQEGAWSAVRLPGPSNPHGDAEAVNANDVRGLPIVREGLLLSVDADTMRLGPQTDYRFADAADLHRPDDPVNEYGFLHTSPAHVLLFPRPHVDPGIRELRTRSAPRFADLYARCTSKGLFPPAANAITLPPNVLVVDPATGGFRLRDDVNIGAPRPPLIIAQRGSDVMQVDYSGATLSLSVGQTGWHVDMPGLELWTDCLGIPRVSGMRTRLVAGTHERPVVRDIQALLKSEIETALTFLVGFGDRPQMGPIDLGASNNVVEHKFALEVERHWKFPPEGEELPEVKLSIGGKAEFGWSTDSAPPPDAHPGTTYTVGLLATGGVEGKIPIYAQVVYLLLGAEIEIGGAVELKPSGPAELKFEFELKAFIGVGVQAGVFDGSVAIGYHLAIDGGTVKNGIFGKLEAEVDLKVVKVSVEGELGGLWYDDTSHPPNTHAADLEGEVQVNVELLFIGIHASYSYTDTKYFS